MRNRHASIRARQDKGNFVRFDMACASPDKIVIIPVIFGVRACYGESEDSREVLVIPRRKKEKESNSTESYLLVD